MAIAATDILLKLATTAGSAGNTGTSTPGSSLGKYVSTTQLSGTALNNLFPDITGAENAASQVDYQCLFIHNSHATLTAQSVSVYLSAEVSGGASVALGVDTTAASAVGASSAQALTIADSTTAPSGVSFSSPTTDGTGLSVGDIPAGSVRAIWIRRTAANTSAVSNDGFTLGVAFDTAA